MRYPASEKLEIIRLVEESALPVRRTLERIGIPHATFYRWYDLYQTGGPEALEDSMSAFTPESGHLIGASRDYPFFMNRRTCSTGQSLLASITRTREPSA
jgi:transposase-like protein